MQKNVTFNSRIFKIEVFTGYRHKNPKTRARVFLAISSDLHPFFVSDSNNQKTRTHLPGFLTLGFFFFLFLCLE